MVSDIAGTTRDTVEQSVIIEGIKFRFIDTAGIRTTDDKLEQMGIDRTMKAVERAHIIILMTEPSVEFEHIEPKDKQAVIRVVNKADTISTTELTDALYISARENEGIDALRKALRECVDTTALYRGDAIVSNARHHQALSAALEALNAASTALNTGISSELLAEDIRVAINHIGEVTGGTISSDQILHSIFSSFCIGK